MLTATKPKTCKQCGAEFRPANPSQAVCGRLCGMERARLDQMLDAAAKRGKQ